MLFSWTVASTGVKRNLIACQRLQKFLQNIPSTIPTRGQDNSNEVLFGVKPEHIMFEIDTLASIKIVKNLIQ